MTDVSTDPSSEAPSDAPTQQMMPVSTAAAAPRNSAVLIVAATLAFVAAAITIGALFPDFWDAPSFALLDDTASLAQTAVFAGALVLGGVLLLPRASAPVGAGLLAVVVAFWLQPRVDDIATLASDDGPRAGTGFALITAGFVLALFAAVLSAVVALRPKAWSMSGGVRPIAGLAALFGFAAAVGYAMNPFTIDLGGNLSVDFSGGSPIDPGDSTSARYLWAGVLVVILLAVLPPVAVAVGRRIGSGLALGLLFGMGGIAALRLGAIYGSSEVAGRRVDVGLEGAEGTWTFLAAGGAVLIVTWFGLAAGGVRRPRAASMAPVTSTPPPHEQVVTGHDPQAIVEPDDGPAADDADTAVTTRVDPMPSVGGEKAPDPAEDRPPE